MKVVFLIIATSLLCLLNLLINNCNTTNVYYIIYYIYISLMLILRRQNTIFIKHAHRQPPSKVQIVTRTCWMHIFMKSKQLKINKLISMHLFTMRNGMVYNVCSVFCNFVLSSYSNSISCKFLALSPKHLINVEFHW